MTFGEGIRELRKAKSLTLRGVAKQVKCLARALSVLAGEHSEPGASFKSTIQAAPLATLAPIPSVTAATL